MEDKKYCYAYPHAAITADIVVFGFDGKGLQILLVERGGEPYKGMWALPGGFMKIEESIEECACRELEEETNVKDIYMEQFHVFSRVGRDPRERVVTVAFLALVKKSDFHVIGGDDAAKAEWFKSDELPHLAFDHKDIIETANKVLQDRLKVSPIAFQLLDDKFTLPDIRRIYEAVNGITYDSRNFYRKVMASGILKEVEESRKPDNPRAKISYTIDEDKINNNEPPFNL
ncbi:MAG: NUDIX hydrolase [Muribaculum sp.]|nr:NUDIX hydrolase [Muribaculum sp.]